MTKYRFKIFTADISYTDQRRMLEEQVSEFMTDIKSIVWEQSTKGHHVNLTAIIWWFE